jgi:hypothetical protein
VLRSLAYALLKYDGENPAKAGHDADRPGRRNTERAMKVRADWQDGRPDPEAASHLLDVFRSESADGACDAVVKALNDGVAPASIWDAILSASGELLMRRTGILTLHSVTSSNALRYAYEAAGDPAVRLRMLLQNAAFVALFREGAGKLSDVRVDRLEAAEGEAGRAVRVEDVFDHAPGDRAMAAGRALAYLRQSGATAEPLMAAARRLVFFKGNDAHDYKFSSAVLEDYYHVSPAWRDRLLASSFYYLPSSQTPDNKLVARIRAAFGA